MGTTLDAIKDRPGVRLGISVQIEGWDYILCDADNSTSAASALAAYSAADSTLDYTGAVRGLQIDWGDLRQEMNVWSAEFKPTNLRILVDDGLDDTLGSAVMKTGAGDEYAINADIDPDDTSITIINGGDLSGTSAGTKFWLGAECMTYASSTATTMTPAVRGAFAPFKANTETSQRFAHSHRLPNVGFGVAFKSKLTSQPRRWVGRYVAVRLHRIVGNTWDTYDQAHLVFAGTIQDIQDTANARTVLSCEDIRAKLNNTVLLRDQWRGRLLEGIYIAPGTRLHLTEWDGSTRKTTTDPSPEESLEFTSGTPGTFAPAAGRYTADEIVILLNAWAYNIGAGSYTGKTWQWSRGIDSRLVGEVDRGSAGFEYYLEVENAPPTNGGGGEELLAFLGFDSYQRLSSGGRILAQRGEGDETASAVAEGLPYKSVAFQNSNEIEMQNADGTWTSLGDLAPEPFKSRYTMTTAGDEGFVRIGDHVFVAQYENATKLTSVYQDDALTLMLGGSEVAADATAGAAAGTLVGTREGEPEKFVEQIIFLESDFPEMVASLFCSQEGSGYNHTTYDQLGAGLGAGIPYELLGTTFIDSLHLVDAQSAGSKLTVLIEKPTKLSEVLGADLLLRRASLVFSATGEYKFVVGASPNSDVTEVSLTESTKGGPRESADDAQRATTEHTARYLRNQLKLEYNRGVDGKYTDSLTIINQASVNDFGESKPVTVKARNTWGGDGYAIDSINSLASGVASYLLSTFGLPVKLYKRTINHNYAHLVPGDPITVTDEYARDPETGTRGITSKPGIIFAHSFDWGGEGADPTGEITVLFEDFDRAGTLSPCADVDDTESSGTYSAGYDSTNLYLKLYANRWSDSSEADDVTHFDVGDEIRIVEIDPANGSAPDEWTRTIDAKSEVNQRITISSALSSPAWDAAKKYRIFSANYTSATSSQQNHVYQADLDDLRVQDSRDPYEYGQNPNSLNVSPAWDVATERPERMPSALYGDGVAMTPAHIVNAGRFSANGNAYRSAPQFTFLLSPHVGVVGSSMKLLTAIPICVQANYEQERYLYWTPIIRTSVAAQTARIDMWIMRKSSYAALSAEMNDAIGGFGSFYANLVAAGAYQNNYALSTSTTWEHVTSLAGSYVPLSSVVTDDYGEIMMVLIAKGTNNPAACEFMGLSSCYVGPPE